MKSENREERARWAAVVGDRLIPMPRRLVPVLLIKEQAGVSAEHQLVRDHESPNDEALDDQDEIDLGKGNVFRVVQRQPHARGGLKRSGPAKLAFVLNDEFVIVIDPKQKEASLRRQFALDFKVQLLRDLDGPADRAIAETETILFQDGPVFVTCVDIEKHCAGGQPPPPCNSYLIRVDDEKFVVSTAHPTGHEILVIAGKDPATTMLNQKIGKSFQPVPLDKHVDLTACGVERFTTLPNEQSEGSFTAVRDFILPEEDQDLLDGSNLDWETVSDPSGKWLVIKNVPLPTTFVQVPTSVAIQIPAGYPSTPLDMSFFHPPVCRLNGAVIPCTESTQLIRGVAWQRWSRHYTPQNPWKIGEYNTLTHYLLTLSWLDREARKI